MLAEAMGPELVTAYLALRRHEVARWEAAGETWDPEQVTPWELDSYLSSTDPDRAHPSVS